MTKAAPAGWVRDPPQPTLSPSVLATAEGIVLVKYFFGDRSESVASRFSFKIRQPPKPLVGTKVPTTNPLVHNYFRQDVHVVAN